MHAVVAPYGHWTSPITSEVVTRSGASIGDVAATTRNTSIVYVLSEPKNGGRATLMCETLSGHGSHNLTDASHGTVRSFVHEYGGGACAMISDTDVVFARRVDDKFGVSQVNVHSNECRDLVPLSKDRRHADFDAHDGLIVMIEERHSNTVQNNLACTINGRCFTLHTGHDFYAYPRISPDGTLVAWVTWNHPSMPFWASQMWVAALHREPEPRLSTPVLVAGGHDAVAQQPVWVPGEQSTLLFTYTSDHTADVYEVSVSRCADGCEVSSHRPVGDERAPADVEVQPALWNLNVSSLVAVDARYVIYVETRDGIDSLVLLDRQQRTRTPLECSYTQFSQLRIAADKTLVCVAASASSPSTLVAMDLHNTLNRTTTALTSRVLCSTSTDTISEAYLSMPEPISFPTQLPDGTLSTAYAMYYAPKNPEYLAPTNSLPPCRIMAHSGPTSRATASLDMSIQYWTSRGWAVCAVNFGGSTGYGLDYMRRLNGHWGDVDVRDCVAAAAYLGGTTPPWDLPDMNSSLRLSERDASDGTRKLTLTRTDAPSLLTESLLALGASAVMYMAMVSLRAWSTWLSALAAIVIVAYRLLFRVQAESLTVYPYLGAQLTTTRGVSVPSWLHTDLPYICTTQSRTFVPRDTILDFFMLEAIQHWRVVDYAALATIGPKQSLQVVFPHLKPSRAVYIHTYRRLHDTLIHRQSSPAKARVDANRICLTGRSSGGLTVLCALIQYPDVFCAASSSYGISDLASLAQHTHKYEMHYTTTLLGGTPESVPEVYHTRSAVYHADKIRSPLLLMQGDQDKVVAPDQSRAMAKAIEARGGTVKYVEFAGEGHSFRGGEARRRALEEEYGWCTDAARCMVL